jgi:hypothetical protein
VDKEIKEEKYNREKRKEQRCQGKQRKQIGPIRQKGYCRKDRRNRKQM